ncbi:MAG: methyltransferase domain-containing protein [Anaerolineae bacterium]|nr:methyltransferase domain-containing protein [Anaerolineae bacterium]
MIALNLGCGRRRREGTFGVDRVALPEVDVLADIDQAPLPFASDSVDLVYADHVLEHIRDLVRTMEEGHRVCRGGARVEIEVPYFACVGAFGDPTHVRFFTYETFRFWTEDTDQANWFTRARFSIARRHLVFGKLHRWLGISWWANHLPHIYENFFAYWFPARALQVELIVIKS